MNRAVEQLLKRYSGTSRISRERALREIMQEIALVGLWRTDFFNKAAFYGGTALRILYGLDRFSEDLDFTLIEADKDFSWEPFEQAIVQELETYGFEVAFAQRMKPVDTPIRSAFLKANTLQELIRIGVGRHELTELHPDTVLKIKIEIDTAPTMQYACEQQYMKAPLAAAITTVKLEDIYPAKVHCAFFRAWKHRVKGRDWYDMVWLIQKEIPFSLSLFSQHMGTEDRLSQDEFMELASKRIEQLDVAKALEDVRAFVQDDAILREWSPQFFKYWLARMRFV